MRASRPVVRPIVLPVALPTDPPVAVLGSRVFVVLRVPIVLPIRDVDFASAERWLAADFFFATDNDGSLVPMKLPIPRSRWVRSDDFVELTAGCFAPDRIEELFSEESLARSPIEPPIREAPRERAAGCSALLGTDGLVVLILLPIREVILGLILLLVLVVVRFVIVFRDLVLDGLLVLLEEFARLLDCVDGPIELTIRDVMLGLILLLVFLVERFVITLLERLKFKLLLLELLTLDVPLLELVILDVPLLEVLLFVIALLELLLLGVRFVTIRLELLVLGVRVVMLLLGVRFVITLLELLLDDLLVMTLLELGLEVLELIDRLEVILLELLLLLEVMLLLGARLVTDLLELLLLGVLLTDGRLDVLLDETLLDLLDEDLAVEDDLEDDRLELFDLLLDRDDLAANTGSQNNKSAKNTQKTRKSESFRRDSTTLIVDF